MRKHLLSIRFALMLLVALSFGASSLHARVRVQWTARFPGPHHCFGASVNVGVDSLDNVYTVQPGGWHAWSWLASKYSPGGVVLWRVTYNQFPNIETYPTDMIVDAAGNLYVVGWIHNSTIQADIVVVKYNTSGQQVWEAIYSDATRFSRGEVIALDHLGNIYVGGTSSADQYGQTDYLTVKYNSLGVEQWSARHTGPNPFDQLVDLAVDAVGNVMVTGWTGMALTIPDYSPTNYLTVSYNAQGMEQWAAVYNGPAGDLDDMPCAVKVDSRGYVIVAGYSQLQDYPAIDDYCTIKYNSQGVQQWIQNYPGSIPWSEFWASDMTLDDHDNIIVTGSENDQGLWTVKYNSQGVMQWSRSYPSGYFAGGAITDVQGNVYVTGGTVVNNPEWMMLCTTLKYNPQGDLRWVSLYDEPNLDLEQYGLDLALDSHQNVIVSARIDAGAMGDQMLLLKLNQTPDDLATKVDNDNKVNPSSFSLHPCSPNPFNPTTVLSFELRVPSQVSLMVYDTAGRLVTTLVDGWQEAGTHEVTFDGSKFSSGLYFVNMQVGTFSQVSKMMLVK